MKVPDQLPERWERVRSLESVGYTPAVVCFLVSGDSVLLGRRKKVSNNLGQDLVSGIGGKLESGESAREAAIREIEEEIGLCVHSRSLQHRGLMVFNFGEKADWNQVVQIFVADEWEGDPVETDVISPEWHPISELPTGSMWEDNAHWLPLVLSGEVIDGVFFYNGYSVVDFDIYPGILADGCSSI